MKKIIFMGLIVLAFSACQDTYTTEEYYTNVHTYSKAYTIGWYLDKDVEYYWEDDGYDDTGLYYYCTIEEPNLTKEVFQYGQLNAYLYYMPKDVNSRVLSPLPFSDFLTGTDQYGNFIKWEEQLTVEFEPGFITFILKFDDHAQLDPSFDPYDFAVKFMW
jgi:hypothetical protein